MCGICGAINLRGEPIPDLGRKLEVMNDLIAHRGPDDDGIWMHERGHVGLAHRRLSIFDLAHGHQPMTDESGSWLTFNGEVYNYPELRTELGRGFETTCDTEVVIRAHEQWGMDALERFRGMFSYALWDEQAGELVCVRDRFGIKPFYYAVVDDVFYFASEVKALLPVLPAVETDLEGLRDYLAFQFCLAGKTLFKGVRELQPGHYLRLRERGHGAPPLLGGLLRDRLRPRRRPTSPSRSRSCWPSRSSSTCAPTSRCRRISPAASTPARSPRWRACAQPGLPAFTGKFSEDPRYDESAYARIVADQRGPRAARDRHRRRATSSSTSRTSPTTWTIRRPAPARSPSTWSRRPRPSRSR